MEQLSIYIKTIIILVLASSFGELLLPKGDMKKYVRFVAGLLITAAFVAPLTNWEALGSLDIPQPPEGAYSTEFGDRQIKEVYIAQLQEHLQHKFAVDQVELEVDDQFRIVDVVTPNDSATAAVRAYLGL